jgi:murein DD-endopeptidase MepM/ murein hydrolase activator NlpD
MHYLASPMLALALGCGNAPLPAPTPVAATGLEAASAQARLREAGERFVTAFLAGDGDTLWPMLDPEMQKVFGSRNGIRQHRDELYAEHGAATAAGASYLRPAEDMFVYSRAYAFAKTRARFSLVAVFLPDGKVAGFTLKALEPEAETPYLAYRTKADLRLPFEGRWTVAWGGRTVDANYHAAYRGQRFAYDLGITRDGQTHSGDGTRNEQYHCYGARILAPAAGKVLVAVDGLPDNPPGKMDPAHAAGNYVLIDLGHDEYAVLCHLQPGSLKVRVGDLVASGQPLGLCGNSGNTSEPHLHFHLQDKPRFEFKPDEYSLPAQFQSYRSNGKPVSRGEPSRDELVERM